MNESLADVDLATLGIVQGSRPIALQLVADDDGRATIGRDAHADNVVGQFGVLEERDAAPTPFVDRVPQDREGVNLLLGELRVIANLELFQWHLLSPFVA